MLLWDLLRVARGYSRGGFFFRRWPHNYDPVKRFLIMLYTDVQLLFIIAVVCSGGVGWFPCSAVGFALVATCLHLTYDIISHNIMTSYDI